jgi:para-nitrobenzyl esterase
MSDAPATVTVTTDRGTVVGLRREDVRVFKGIRYGQATRFAPSIVSTSWRDGWTGALDATTYGSQCPQLPGLLERSLGSGSLPSDEDCLFLNVFAPAPSDRAKPVLVWIHGGAYTTGTAAMPWYDGSNLVRRGDVVVVTINYRLGVLGFPGRANLGSLDQINALQWVRSHIASFGGDPDNVTVFGESAGGSSLIALMASPAATGLFHRGLAMSPSISQLRRGQLADDAWQRYLDIAAAASIDDLVDAPLERLMDAQQTFLADARMGFTGFSPSGDSTSIPGDILGAAAVNPLPLVVGTTRDEAALWNAFNPQVAELSDEALAAHAERRFGGNATQALAMYDELERVRSNVDALTAVMTDETFRRPAQRLAEARSAHGHPTWMYWFTWASPTFGGRLGSCHAMDIPFAFDNLDRKGVAAFTGDGDDRQAVANQFAALTTAFAKHGDPGWPAFDTATRPTMRIDVAGGLIHDPEPHLRALWH